MTWAGLLLVVTLVGAAFGIAMHTLIVRSWLIALYGTTKMVARKTVQMGHVQPRRAPTGEVLSVASGDADEFGALTEITARATAQLVAYLLVAAIVLNISTTMGVLVLVAAPVLVGVALPLLRPLQRRQEIERSRTSELTSMATDIVAGLRILRGIGGERTFGRNYATQSQLARRAGVSAGIWQAGIEALGVLFSGCFLVLLMWAGTREVLAGDLTVGQLISFLGYGLFMVGPIQSFFEFFQKLTRALVSARKAIGIFEQEPPWGPSMSTASTAALPAAGDLVDEASRFVASDRLLTIVVSALPEDSAALADRLGRYLPVDTEPVSQEPDEALTGRARRRARAERLAERQRIAELDEERANRPWGVRLGDVDLGTGPAGRRTTANRGQRHRQPAVRRHSPGRHRSARPAHPRDGRGDPAGGRRRGRVRRDARRVAGSAGRARPRPFRRTAAAGGARTGTGDRCADAGPGRADLRGRRPHRGQDRRARRRASTWADHGRRHRLTAVAAPCGPRRPARRRIRRRQPAVTRSCWRPTPPTDVSSRGRSMPHRSRRPIRARTGDRNPAGGRTGSSGRRRRAMLDLLASSRDTWRDRSHDAPAVPPELVPDPDAPWPDRIRALRSRHLLREQRAAGVYEQSRSPERGWPVADNAAVFEFLGRLLSERRGVFAAMVLFNALAAATGLLVPRLLGDLIDRTVAGGSSTANVSTLALVIIGVVVAQSLLTFLGQWTSTVFGQDILSSAREYIVETILRLPLGRVEGASTGDLVTRVTRDVGTMSRSVQYGVPMAIISLLTVVLSIVAMLLNSVFLAVPALVLIGASMFQVRRYLVRAQKCYITEGATYSRINTTLSETVEGARTVEALGLEELRVRDGRRRHRRVRSGRALRDDAAQPAVRGDRRRVQRAPGDHDPGRRLRLQPRLGVPGRDHGRRTLRRGPERAAGPPRGRGRPAPGRCGVDQSSAGHRPGAARTARPATGFAVGTRAGRARTCASPTARATTYSTGWT